MALTGAIYGQKCYNTPFEAVDAYYSNVAPAQTPGTTTFVVQYVKTGSIWYQKSYSISSTGVWTTRSTTVAPLPTFPACDPSEKFLDGVTLGWGVATAMIAVAALMFIKKGARGG